MSPKRGSRHGEGRGPNMCVGPLRRLYLYTWLRWERAHIGIWEFVQWRRQQRLWKRELRGWKTQGPISTVATNVWIPKANMPNMSTITELVGKTMTGCCFFCSDGTFLWLFWNTQFHLLYLRLEGKDRCLQNKNKQTPVPEDTSQQVWSIIPAGLSSWGHVNKSGTIFIFSFVSAALADDMSSDMGPHSWTWLFKAYLSSWGHVNQYGINFMNMFCFKTYPF